MARRIDIEITSKLDDDRFTWRASGAKEPRGTLDGSLLPGHVAPGATLRAEVEFSIDGVEVTKLETLDAVAKPAKKVETIELLGSGRQQAGVTWTLEAKKKGRRDGDRKPRGDGDRRPGRPGAEGRERGPRAGGPSRPQGDRRTQGQGRGQGAASTLPQSTEHRNRFLSELPAENVPVAEQLLRGGMPAVRQAIAEQARSGGLPAPEEAIISMAEALLPGTLLAAWKDRAAAAISAGKETRLRDLRAIVSASRSLSMDEEAKAMAKQLRETLDQRSSALSNEWLARINTALDEGRFVDALNSAARPPEHATRLSAELAKRLAEDVSAAMTPDTPPREWMAMLDAVCDTPVRRNVKPVGIPAENDVEAAARNAAGLVPELAKLLGLRIPPPPPRRPVRVERRSEPS